MQIVWYQCIELSILVVILLSLILSIIKIIYFKFQMQKMMQCDFVGDNTNSKQDRFRLS